MGKRSKSRSTTGEELVVTGKDVKNNKKNIDDNIASDEYKQDESVTIVTDKKLKIKIKNNSQPNKINIEDKVTTDESKCHEPITIAKDKKPKRKKKNNSQTSTLDSGKKNKKIIFNDDDDESVVVENPPQKRSKVKLSQENEEDVKDEDIDNFCNEITEEDNEQYENWVKLIEDKLHSNKKKPK